MRKLQKIINILLICLLINSPASLLAYTETFYLCASGNGSAPETDSCTGAFDAADFNNSANWAAIDSNDGKIGPNDLVEMKDDDGVIRATLTFQNNGLSGKRITFSCQSGDTCDVYMSELIASGSWSLVSNDVYSATASEDFTVGVRETGSTRANGYHFYDLTGDEDGLDWDPSNIDTNSDGTIDDTASMEDNFFYSRGNNTTVYYKRTAGAPPNMEVGERVTGITTAGYNYITIDGINVYGPSGSTVDEDMDMYGILVGDGSEYVTVENLEVKYVYGRGIQVRGERGIVIDNVTIDDCSYGIRMTGAGGSASSQGGGVTVQNCTVTNIATKSKDYGDNNSIGGNSSDWILVQDNTVTTNGWAGRYSFIDAAVTFVTGCDNIVIRRNTITDSAQDAIQIAGDSGYSTNFEISYNVIDTFGARITGSASDSASQRKCNGIVLGGGVEPADLDNITVYNNLIINGSNNAYCNAKGSGLLIWWFEMENVAIKNNTFHNNTALLYEIWERGATQQGTWDIDHNVIYRESGNAIFWSPGATDIYDYTQIGDWETDYAEVGTNNFNPKDTAETPGLTNAAGGDYTLADGSVCIDAGEDVGLAEDLANTYVPQNIVPDIGPYEYVGAAPATNAITGIGGGGGGSIQQGDDGTIQGE